MNQKAAAEAAATWAEPAEEGREKKEKRVEEGKVQSASDEKKNHDPGMHDLGHGFVLSSLRPSSRT